MLAALPAAAGRSICRKPLPAAWPKRGVSVSARQAVIHTSDQQKRTHSCFFFPPSSLDSCLACVNSQILVQAALAICSHR